MIFVILPHEGLVNLLLSGVLQRDLDESEGVESDIESRV